MAFYVFSGLDNAQESLIPISVKEAVELSMRFSSVSSARCKCAGGGSNKCEVESVAQDFPFPRLGCPSCILRDFVIKNPETTTSFVDRQLLVSAIFSGIPEIFFCKTHGRVHFCVTGVGGRCFYNKTCSLGKAPEVPLRIWYAEALEAGNEWLRECTVRSTATGVISRNHHYQIDNKSHACSRACISSEAIWLPLRSTGGEGIHICVKGVCAEAEHIRRWGIEHLTPKKRFQGLLACKEDDLLPQVFVCQSGFKVHICDDQCDLLIPGSNLGRNAVTLDLLCPLSLQTRDKELAPMDLAQSFSVGNPVLFDLVYNGPSRKAEKSVDSDVLQASDIDICADPAGHLARALSCNGVKSINLLRPHTRLAVTSRIFLMTALMQLAGDRIDHGFDSLPSFAKVGAASSLRNGLTWEDALQSATEETGSQIAKHAFDSSAASALIRVAPAIKIGMARTFSEFVIRTWSDLCKMAEHIGITIPKVHIFALGVFFLSALAGTGVVIKDDVLQTKEVVIEPDSEWKALGIDHAAFFAFSEQHKINLKGSKKCIADFVDAVYNTIFLAGAGDPLTSRRKFYFSEELDTTSLTFLAF